MLAPLLALLLLATPALAGTVVVGGAGGLDFPTTQPWVGPEVALHADRSPGVLVPTGRLAAVYAFEDARPAAIAEVGLLARVPDRNRTVRAGLAVRTWFLRAPYRLPIGWDADDQHHDRIGFIPSVVGRIEFEFTKRRTFVFGVEAGVAASASAYLCDANDTDQANCLSWFPGLVGGLYGRGELTQRLYVDAVLGPSARVAVGYRLGPRRDLRPPTAPAPAPADPAAVEPAAPE